MKVAILGDTGMLGGMLKAELKAQGMNVVGLSRKDGLNIGPYYNEAQVLNSFNCLDSPDFIVNCVGAIKPVFNDEARLTEAIYTNAIFPHELVSWNHRFEVGARIIHITTDCVFDGLDGYYTENSPHNATDDYGRSKSLGEPSNCMVLRTSIIGPEWGGNKRSLVEWFLSNKGREVNGYTNHMWNGLTTLELSSCISDIIAEDMYDNGTFHLFSSSVSKYELLKAMNRAWELGITANPIEAKTFCNRILMTVRELNSVLKPKSLHEMLEEMKYFVEMER